VVWKTNSPREKCRRKSPKRWKRVPRRWQKKTDSAGDKTSGAACGGKGKKRKGGRDRGREVPRVKIKRFCRAPYICTQRKGRVFEAEGRGKKGVTIRSWKKKNDSPVWQRKTARQGGKKASDQKACAIYQQKRRPTPGRPNQRRRKPFQFEGEEGSPNSFFIDKKSFSIGQEKNKGNGNACKE